MKSFIKRIQENKFIQTFLSFYRAADSDLTSIAVAYYFLISIFPLLLIISNILPYFQIPSEKVLTSLEEFLPASLYSMIFDMVRQILTQPSSGLLSFSILSALWTFSQSMSFLQKAFNKAYGIEKGRGMIWQRLLSLLVSLGLQALLAVSLVLTLFGRRLLELVHHFWPFDEGLYQQLLGMTGPTLYLLLFGSLLMLYYFLPDVKIPRIRYVLPGALFVVLTLFALLHVFSAYLDSYLSHVIDVRFFGSLIIFGIMFWFIIISKILIYGAILNASYQSLKEQK